MSIYTSEERKRISDLDLPDESKNRLLQRIDEIELPAFKDFNSTLELYLELDKQYRVFGYDAMSEAFEDAYQKNSGGDPSGYELLRNNKDWLMKGLYAQESLLHTFIEKYEYVEAIHNLKLRNVDHTIALWQSVIDRMRIINC